MDTIIGLVIVFTSIPKEMILYDGTFFYILALFAVAIQVVSLHTADAVSSPGTNTINSSTSAPQNAHARAHIPFVRQPRHAEPDPNLDWASFGFGLNGVSTDYIWLDKVVSKQEYLQVGNASLSLSFSKSAEKCLLSTRPLILGPSSTVLNYGQCLFEGLKAFRRKDGSVVVFRPEQNANRLAIGAKRFMLPTVPNEVFLEAIDSVVRANSKFIPQSGKGALYLRPLLFGSGEALGVKPSEEATFCIYAAPVGNYFKGDLKCISLQAVNGIARAARGGSGNIKAGGNYAPPFLAQKQVRERGYDAALFLDAVHGEFIEEAGASNFFAIFKDGTVVTPTLDTNTILPGITRSSLIELARSELGLEVEERQISIHELKNDVEECFCCGTGASVTPVGIVSYSSDPCREIDGVDFEVTFGDGKCPGPITQKLYKLLLGIQNGECSDVQKKYRHWIHIVEP